MTTTTLVPLLVVRDAPRAIDFYVNALGAEVLARYEHGPNHHVSHADLALRGAPFAVTEEARAWNSDAPPSLGGSPVVLQLAVDDVDAALASMTSAGAAVVFPPVDLFGERMARARDPFGHLWILRRRFAALSVEEIQRERDALFASVAPVRAATPSAAAPLEEIANVADAPHTPQAPRPRGRVHLTVGPVGAGKSTFGLGLARSHGAVRLTLDEWMTDLFRQDRPETGVVEWYTERAERCLDRIWALARAIVATGTDVVLEVGLLDRPARERFHRRVREAGLELLVYVLDAARDVRRARVEARNRARGTTFSMVVPPAIFELASDLWQPVGPDEWEGAAVRFVRTDDP